MIQIVIYEGLDKRLYEVIGPLVMNPEILKTNRNYPFKTTKKHLWFIAMDEGRVVGFLPVELKNKEAIINNYYTQQDDPDILNTMIQNAMALLKKEYVLVSVTQNQHLKTFADNKFIVEREWKNYVKMRLIK